MLRRETLQQRVGMLGVSYPGWLTVMAMLDFFAGLRRTGPSTAAILSTFEPVVTTALAALTLNEFLTPVQLVGGLVVLSSVAVLHLRPQRRRAGSPEHPSPVVTG